MAERKAVMKAAEADVRRLVSRYFDKPNPSNG